MENETNDKPAEEVVAEEEVTEDEAKGLDTELPEDTTDWKAEAQKARRIASRYRNKVTKLTEAKKPEPTAPAATPQPQTKQDLDYGQKAYLRAEGIKAPKEEALVKEWIKDTGKTLENVLGNKRFQAELAELREATTTQDAIPSSANRSQAQSQSDVAYWLTQPFSKVPADMRMKVIEARKKADKDTSKPDF